MLENPSLLDGKNKSWTVLKSRTAFLSVILISALFLIIKSLLFAPKAPDRPFILTNPGGPEILEAVNWYSKNSMGSLKLENNRCILEVKGKEALCKSSLDKVGLLKNHRELQEIKTDKLNWPYIWLTKAYDKEVTLEFALFKLDPINVTSKISRHTVLGTELVVEVEFQKSELTAISKELLDQTEIKELEKDIGSKFTGSVSFLPNPYGYYLPIYPLP